jgi:hypothetical protein
MDPGSVAPWVVPVAGAACGLLAAIGLGVFRRINRRSEELRALAALYRWTFSPDAPELARHWRGTPFGLGSNRRATEVFTGSYRGHHFAVFTYSYTPPAPPADDAGPARAAVASPAVSAHPAVSSPAAGRDDGTGTDTAADACPQAGAAPPEQRYSVYSLSMGHRVPTIEFTPAGAEPPPADLGGHTVAFASADFSAAWTVTAGSPTVAYGIVNPEFVAWLMRADHAMPLRFEGSDALTWRIGGLRPSSIIPILDMLVEAAQLVPQYVRAAYTPPEVRLPHRLATRLGPPTPVAGLRPPMPSAPSVPPRPAGRPSLRPPDPGTLPAEPDRSSPPPELPAAAPPTSTFGWPRGPWRGGGAGIPPASE